MSYKSRLQALLTYANETTGVEDTTLGDAIKTLADGYSGSGGDSSTTFPTITDATSLSDKLRALIAYGNSVSGSTTDDSISDVVKTLVKGQTPQWMTDAAETYGINIANLKQAMQDYTFVEYLASAGTQYINTGYIPNPNTCIDICFMQTDTLIDEAPFGSRYSAGNSQYIVFFGSKNMFFANIWQTTNKTLSYGYFVGKCRLKIQGDKLHLTMNDGYTFDCNTHEGSETTSNAVTMYVFAANQNGAVNRKFTGEVYNCRLYEDDTTQRILFPCKRKSDSKPLMLDLLTMTEYVNQGSGDDFTYGDEASLESKFAELSA